MALDPSLSLSVLRERENKICWCQTVVSDSVRRPLFWETYYSPTRNGGITSLVSWSSLMNLSHLSPAKVGGTKELSFR